MGFGVRNSEFGVRSSEFGVRSSEFGIRPKGLGGFGVRIPLLQTRRITSCCEEVSFRTHYLLLMKGTLLPYLGFPSVADPYYSYEL
jgi:hypothetical protein